MKSHLKLYLLPRCRKKAEVKTSEPIIDYKTRRQILNIRSLLDTRSGSCNWLIDLDGLFPMVFDPMRIDDFVPMAKSDKKTTYCNQIDFKLIVKGQELTEMEMDASCGNSTGVFHSDLHRISHRTVTSIRSKTIRR